MHLVAFPLTLGAYCLPSPTAVSSPTPAASPQIDEDLVSLQSELPRLLIDRRLVSDRRQLILDERTKRLREVGLAFKPHMAATRFRSAALGWRETEVDDWLRRPV